MIDLSSISIQAIKWMHLKFTIKLYDGGRQGKETIVFGNA
jgi:hypothetical protein